MYTQYSQKTFNGVTLPTDDYDVEAWNAFYAANPNFNRSVGADGDNGGAGGSGGDGGNGGGDGGSGGGNVGSDVTKTPEFQAALDREISGLKTKNDELLGKLNKTQETLKQFDGIDPEKTKNMLKNFEQSEEAKLIADGKLDEVIQKRTERLEAEWSDKYKTVEEQLNEYKTKAQTYEQQITQGKIDDSFRKLAVDSKARPDATGDILRRARDVFTLNDKGELEARDNDGNLLKTSDGMLMTPERFVEELKSTAPYYWPESEGSGAGGNDGNSGSRQENEKKLAEYAAKGDMENYRALRKKMSGDNYHGRG